MIFQMLEVETIKKNLFTEGMIPWRGMLTKKN